jgi:hypothetical protein
MRTMNAGRIHAFGGLDVLHLDEIPVPEPHQREILLNIGAATVNPVEYKDSRRLRRRRSFGYPGGQGRAVRRRGGAALPAGEHPRGKVVLTMT